MQTQIQALDWFIADGKIKAETEYGTYTVEHGSETFVVRFEPHTILLSSPTELLADCLQTCEQHHQKQLTHVNLDGTYPKL
jgi:hypothetical protein